MRQMSERIQSSSSWEGDAVYQVYPYTFNEVRPPGEEHIGIGTIQGITEKRDYLYDLGVDALWIPPFYPSPMIDGGYDISDPTGIEPKLGNLADFDNLISAYHERGMKVMVDIVPNHTSDQHPWFQQSRLSKNNPKSDWYIWHDPAPGGGPPNNWSSVFSFPNLRARQNETLIVPEGENTPPVSAWQYDPAREQYYLRDFAKEQPNLNWQNPQVREAMKDVIRTWIRRGVDGFRIDVANHLGKNPDFTDEVLSPTYREGIDNPHDQHIFYNSLNYPPTLYPYLRELTGVLDEFPERDLRMVLESWMPEEDLQKVDRVAPHTTSSFNFTRLTAPWNAQTHKRLLDTYYDNLPDYGIATQVQSNHDVKRVRSRLGEAARTAAFVNLTLEGNIYIYNGEEGGFPDAPIPQHRRRDDGLGERDGARAPMMWDASRNAGFSDAHPDELWLPVDPRYRELNLARQAQDPHSYFSLHRTLLNMRRANPTLRHGQYHGLSADHIDALAFAKRLDNDQTVTLANFSTERPTSTTIGNTQQRMGRVVLSTHPGRRLFETIDLSEPVTLEPGEAVLIMRPA
jgi:alpha-glucosidase